MNPIDLLLRLLKPVTAACLLCGRPDRSGQQVGTELPSHTRYAAKWLCRTCTITLPWIEPCAIACHTCGRAVSCPDCPRGLSDTLIRSRSAVQYDPSMKELLARYKYAGDEQLLPLLSAMLYPVVEELTAHLHQLRHPVPVDRHGRRGYRYNGSPRTLLMSRYAALRSRASAVWDAVTFVPISSQRAQERGFNQAQQLAETVAVRYGLEAVPLLSRVRDSQRQSHQTRHGRIENTANLFVANTERLQSAAARARVIGGASREQPMTILIVDDIYTTGSTLRACADALSAAEAMKGVRVEVYGLTWARA